MNGPRRAVAGWQRHAERRHHCRRGKNVGINSSATETRPSLGTTPSIFKFLRCRVNLSCSSCLAKVRVPVVCRGRTTSIARLRSGRTSTWELTFDGHLTDRTTAPLKPASPSFLSLASLVALRHAARNWRVALAAPTFFDGANLLRGAPQTALQMFSSSFSWEAFVSPRDHAPAAAHHVASGR